MRRGSSCRTVCSGREPEFPPVVRRDEAYWVDVLTLSFDRTPLHLRALRPRFRQASKRKEQKREDTRQKSRRRAVRRRARELEQHERYQARDAKVEAARVERVARAMQRARPPRPRCHCGKLTADGGPLCVLHKLRAARVASTG